MVAVVVATAVLALPHDAFAQRHRGRGRGRVAVAVVPARVHIGYGYGYYDPFWGYTGWYPYGWYGWNAPYYRPIRYGGNVASARVQVKPRNAEVYVDGHFVGTVDDFDGFLQRLDVPPGEHELTVYLEGYRTMRQKVLFRPGATLNIKYELQPLGPGEAAEPRPQAPPDERGPGPRHRRAPYDDHTRPSSEFGTLAVRVQPRAATLLVDGEEWTASEGTGPIHIELREGPHEIEVRHEGFSTFRRTVNVRAGETVSLNVSLSR
jgi:hypothetical protein